MDEKGENYEEGQKGQKLSLDKLSSIQIKNGALFILNMRKETAKAKRGRDTGQKGAFNPHVQQLLIFEIIMKIYAL